jgi:2-furoyl-CoA dehydrogenase FAD binding subunit
MKPAPFDYVMAESLDEAFDALASAGDGGRIIGGGQSLMAILNMRLAKPEVLIDISRVPGLKEIKVNTDSVEVGAGVTQAALLDWPQLTDAIPLLAKALPHVGHIQTRNRGTVCGSLCHADPSSEIPLVLATLGGEMVLRSKSGSRIVKASDFQTGMLATSKRSDEIAVSARFPKARPGAGFGFAEFNRRHGDFAIVAVAAIAEGDKLRLGVGGVADAPVVRDFKLLRGSELKIALNDFAWECGGYDDIHSTARHRRELVRSLGRNVIEEALKCRG